MCLVSDDNVDELLLRDAGEAGTEESGLVPCGELVVLLTAAAAAVGLQWTQMKTLNPRPLQLLQTTLLLSISIADDMKGLMMNGLTVVHCLHSFGMS